MAVKSVEEFLAVLEKSKLLIPAQLDQARAAAATAQDPLTVAKSLARQGLITRWQAGQLLAGRSAFYLGKYRLIELLGRGSMGNVFLGQHVTMNRRVALRVISREVSNDPGLLRRFLDDARAISKLDHPNIVQSYSVDNESGRYFLVNEYVEGVALQRLVDDDGPLECQLAVDYVRQAADGLDHGHRHNITHYGIRPSKLLVNLQGVLKIVDLGLAWLSDGGQPAAAALSRPDSDAVDYLAPEQTLEAGNPDHRSDIYSLGCVLHYLLMGHPSFRQGTPAERIASHQTQDLPDLHVEQPKIPEELAAICRRMTARKPEDRYQTAAELSRELAEWQASAPPVDREAKLKKAEPLNEPDSSDPFGIDYEEGFRRRSAGRKAGGAAKAGDAKPDAEAEPTRPKVSKRMILVIALASLVVLLVLVLVWAVMPRQPKNLAVALPTVKTAVKPPPAAKPESPKPEPPKPVQPEPAKAAPPKTEPPKAEPPKQEPAKPEPPKAEPPKREPAKAEPPKPEPAKAEPPKKAEPLAGLGDAVDLPPLPEKGRPAAADAVVSLGKIDPHQADELAIVLVGGEEMLRGGRGFSLEREGSGPTWLIGWQSDAKGAAAAEAPQVAKISLEQDALQFRWLAKAAEVPAGYLRNCGLTVSVGQASRFMMLCRPQKVEAVVIDWDRRTTRVNLARANLPETGSVRLQITGFSGPFPSKYVMNPSEPIAPRGKTDVVFGDAKLASVVFRIGFDVKTQGAQLDLALLCRLPGQAKPTPLNVKEAERLAKQLFALRSQLETVVKSLDAKDAKRKTLQQQLDQGGAIVDQMTALGELYKAVNKTARIHFRIFNQLGDRQIDLLVTPSADAKAEEQPAAPVVGKKPAKKRK